MRRKDDDVLLITCKQALALVQMPQGKPMRLPADWKEKYAALYEKGSKAADTEAQS